MRTFIDMTISEARLKQWTSTFTHELPSKCGRPEAIAMAIEILRLRKELEELKPKMEERSI